MPFNRKSTSEIEGLTSSWKNSEIVRYAPSMQWLLGRSGQQAMFDRRLWSIMFHGCAWLHQYPETSVSPWSSWAEMLHVVILKTRQYILWLANHYAIKRCLVPLYATTGRLKEWDILTCVIYHCCVIWAWFVVDGVLLAHSLKWNCCIKCEPQAGFVLCMVPGICRKLGYTLACESLWLNGGIPDTLNM